MTTDAMVGLLGVVIGAIVSAGATYFALRQPILMKECRDAVRDLKRFRRLEDIWAAELAAALGPDAKPESERLRMRRKLEEKIGDFGEPARIAKLLERLE